MNATITNKAPHIAVHRAAATARVVDMTNAWKVGKQCPCFVVLGWHHPGAHDDPGKAATDATGNILWLLLEEAAGLDYDALRAKVLELAAPHPAIRVFDETIRAVDAPRPLLTAGVEKVFHARADESGICIDDETDQFNLPCYITPSTQRGPAAYKLAAKVWAQVQAAKTAGAAAKVLREAGCHIHYFCRMD